MIIMSNQGKRILLVDDARTDAHIEIMCSMIARDYDMALIALQNSHWDIVYLDHDLGIGQTGYDVICWLEEQIHEGKVKLPGRIECVSANPSGRKRIELVISKLYGRI